MKKTKRRALYVFAALLGALFVLSCLVGFAACGGGSKDCAHENVTWDETKTVDATCEKDGSKTGTCDDCGETVTETIPALGHDWDTGVVTTAATCTTEGVKTYTCTVCGETKTETIEKLSETGEHTWGEGVVTTPATTEAEGEMTYTCTDCGATYTESIAKLERLVVPDPENNELDAAAMKLNSTESFEGYDYTVAKTTTTNENEEEETVYVITGTASAMTEDIVKWYNGGETGAAKVGDSYITLKIYVGIGNTISYTSAGDEEKSYTNTDGSGIFDGDYYFVCERLTGVNSDESQVTTLDGVSYTITDGSGTTIEEVNIEFDMTIPWDGESCSLAWYDESMSKGNPTVAITIYSGAELAGLAKLEDEFDFDEHQDTDTSMTRHWTVTLAADIDLCNYPWTPIGSKTDHHFDGDFDGAGHIISNLYVDTKDHAMEDYVGTGLFGYVCGGTLENVTINNVYSSGRRIVGTLAGNASSYVYDNSGDHHLHIENCHVTGLIQVSGYHQVGGLVGVCEEAYITDCSVEGDAGSYVKSEYAVDQFTDETGSKDEDNYDAASDDYDGDAAGGLIGYMHTSTAGAGIASGATDEQKAAAMADFCGITDCTVSGFDISGCRKVGGLIGHNCGSVEFSGCTVSDCQIHLVYNSAYSDKIDSGSPRLFVGALVGEFEWLQKVTADCTVSNVTVVYISDDGVTGNYTPEAGETNPYAGLFGGSRNQGGSDSEGKYYARIQYAELGESSGTYATVKVTDFTLTKSRVTAAAEGDDRLGSFSSTEISVEYDEETKTYIVSGTSFAFGDNVGDFWGSAADSHADCEYIAFEIIVGANETLRVTTVDADGTTKEFALYGVNVTDKTLKGADGSTELKVADGVWIVDVTKEDNHEGSSKMTIEVIGADGQVTETYYVVIGTITSAETETIPE